MGKKSKSAGGGDAHGSSPSAKSASNTAATAAAAAAAAAETTTPSSSSSSRQSDVAVLSAALDGGAPIDRRDAHGRTLLHVAAAQARVDIVTMLVRRGAALELRAADGCTPLLAACLAPPAPQRLSTVRALLSAGADVNAAFADGITPVCGAVLARSRELLDVLVDAGGSLAARGDGGVSPLTLAFSYARTDRDYTFASHLLARGAPPDDMSDAGFSLLWRLIEDVDLIGAHTLLEAGADVNVASCVERDTRTLDLLITDAQLPPEVKLRFVELLFTFGADLNHVSDDGLTPLDQAIVQGPSHEPIVKFMLLNGADRSVLLSKDDESLLERKQKERAAAAATERHRSSRAALRARVQRNAAAAAATTTGDDAPKLLKDATTSNTNDTLRNVNKAKAKKSKGTPSSSSAASSSSSVTASSSSSSSSSPPSSMTAQIFERITTHRAYPYVLVALCIGVLVVAWHMPETPLNFPEQPPSSMSSSSLPSSSSSSSSSSLSPETTTGNSVEL